MLICTSPLLLLPDAVSGPAEGGAKVMSELDIAFAGRRSRRASTADNLLSALGFLISFRGTSSGLLLSYGLKFVFG